MRTVSSLNGPRRYTIARLLQIGQESCVQPFDLSRFTYDAARAGVVPSLGECAMAVRRTSSGRPRGWSTESTDTLDDVVVFQGTIPRLAPERQPANPPGTSKAQQDEGFARFLKKHSSPTHNRVTTGGRIVPMEKRESPPKFDLQQPYESVQGTPNETMPPPDSVCNVQSQRSEMVEDVAHEEPTPTFSSNSHSVQSRLDAAAAAQPHGLFNQGLTATLPYPNAAISPYYPMHGNPYHTANLDQYMAQLNLANGQSSVPAMPLPWQYQGNPTALITDGTRGAAANFASSQWLSALQMLNQAEVLFNSLDQQLKAIDRHRAVRSHNPNLSAQRMAIVQQRADVKDNIHRLKAQVAYEQTLARIQIPVPFFPPQNVIHQPFAVVEPHPNQQPLRSDKEVASQETSSPLQMDKTQGNAKRKAIPIVPPPNLTPSGVISIREEKELRGENNARQRGGRWEGPEEISSSARTRQGQQSGQEMDATKGVAEEEPSQVNYHSGWTRCEEDFNIGVSHGKEPNDGRAPPGMLALYELQFDALRLPEGVIARISREHGYSQEIAGRGLRRPPSSNMAAWEKKYWDEKPVFTQSMLDNLLSKGEILGLDDQRKQALLSAICNETSCSGKENTLHVNSRWGKVEHFIQDQAKYFSSPKQALEENADLTERTSNPANAIADPTNSDVPVPLKNSALHLADVTTQNGIIKAVGDRMDNKGYSSVYVSNVNVNASLPPSFDGATDPRRRNAKTMLSAASKSRSPPLLQRFTGNGSA